MLGDHPEVNRASPGDDRQSPSNDRLDPVGKLHQHLSVLWRRRIPGQAADIAAQSQQLNAIQAFYFPSHFRHLLWQETIAAVPYIHPENHLVKLTLGTGIVRQRGHYYELGVETGLGQLDRLGGVTEGWRAQQQHVCFDPSLFHPPEIVEPRVSQSSDAAGDHRSRHLWHPTATLGHAYHRDALTST